MWSFSYEDNHGLEVTLLFYSEDLVKTAHESFLDARSRGALSLVGDIQEISGQVLHSIDDVRLSLVWATAGG